ncbi:MAG: phosphopantothenoylcysteine decarboxylase [Planctomycetota bacterium]|nr:phosphopantothenoylcysteine decarboxylase [Planctomycetota bacterium]
MNAPPRVLISAGPTHEPIDAVRYLGNRSSGRMGLSLADAAVAAGCPTTLLLGPTTRTPIDHSMLRVERFQSCADLERLLNDAWPDHELLFMAAAVADYRPVETCEGGKLRRRSGRRSLELEPTPDLLAGLAGCSRDDQLRIGWALEPRDELMSSARAKLDRKSLDAIIANPLETLESDRIEATLLGADGTTRTPDPPSVSKHEFAVWLLEQVLEMHAEARS